MTQHLNWNTSHASFVPVVNQYLCHVVLLFACRTPSCLCLWGATCWTCSVRSRGSLKTSTLKTWNVSHPECLTILLKKQRMDGARTRSTHADSFCCDADRGVEYEFSYARIKSQISGIVNKRPCYQKQPVWSCAPCCHYHHYLYLNRHWCPDNNT